MAQYISTALYTISHLQNGFSSAVIDVPSRASKKKMTAVVNTIRLILSNMNGS